MINLKPGMFVMAESSDVGSLHSLSRDTANRALRVFDSSNDWTYDEFKLATGIRIVTADGCFPCRMWGTKRICYHQLLCGVSSDYRPLLLTRVMTLFVMMSVQEESRDAANRLCSQERDYVLLRGTHLQEKSLKKICTKRLEKRRNEGVRMRSLKRKVF